jgi:hypothetical protein
MEGNPISVHDHLATQLTERFGPLLTHDQLAVLLGRTRVACATASVIPLMTARVL